MPNKMERFTNRSRRVLSYAEQEAARREQSSIGTEHLLLGMLREDGSVAARVLLTLKIQYPQVEALIDRMPPAAPRDPNARLEVSQDVKKVLELAVDEARHMRHHYIGTEHLLLGLVRLQRGNALEILTQLNIRPAALREETLHLLDVLPKDTSEQGTVIREGYPLLSKVPATADDAYYWRLSGKTPLQYPRRAIIRVGVVTFLIWAVVFNVARTASLEGTLIGMGLLTAISATVSSEFYCILIGTHRVTSLIASGHWDLLRMTPRPSEKLFADLYTSIQERCWRVGTAEVILRLVAIEVFGLTIMQADLRVFNYNVLYSELLWSTVLLSIFMLAFLLVESRWRFETITAISIAVSSRAGSFLFATLGSITTIFAIHIVQIVILTFPFWLTLLLRDIATEAAAALCSAPFAFIAWPVLILGFHNRLRNWGLAVAQRELFRVE